MAKRIEYKASPTLVQFHKSQAFVRGIRGPVGSGKSVGCCFEIFNLACQQVPNDDGVRKTRTLIVRNTMPQLETTTLKTWKDWFPPGDPKKNPDTFGRMIGKPPFTHDIRVGLGDGTTVELEVQFLALDKDEDVRKLLSYECSNIWFNEAREIRYSIVSAATARVGRYPSPKDGGCTRKAIIMDTNPPDDEHWWYKLAEEETPSNWEFFSQPSGLAPEAENLENLSQSANWKSQSIEERRQHGRTYYLDMLGGKTEEWTNVYVHGKYGYIKRGVPVYKGAWNSDFHVAKRDLEPVPMLPLVLGIDSSGRHPSTVILQKSKRGQWCVLDEYCILDDEGMGARAYAKNTASWLKRDYPGVRIDSVYGDPAGNFPSQDEQTYFEVLRSEGIPIKAAPTNNPSKRIETVVDVLSRMVDGMPALIVSPKCKHLIKGMNGGYQYKKISTSGGDDRYGDKPLKNRFSDVQDALQYALCGAGEMRTMLGRNWNQENTPGPSARVGCAPL